MHPLKLYLACALFLPLADQARSDEPRDKTIRFNRDVLPILSENCFFCHGPDAKRREADFRLDRREDVLSRSAPQDPDSSEIMQRIRSDDPALQMPPPDSNRHLTPSQKELIREWIQQGTPFEEHWAFLPPSRPSIPDQKPGWIVRNPIDAFIAAKLDELGMEQSPEALPHQQVRRLSLDLTGLPPTEEELAQQVPSWNEQVYDKAVERALASPRYGERMAWDWLEAARYADTNGYQGDPTRSMWYWRDWSIQALNDNMPFNQFTIEQLAGDLLPQPTRQQLIATGFHRNHMINGEGGRIAEESRVEYVQDRVETTGTVWLGLTLNCCRCHDHKYDPFSQEHYYQLAAYFNSIDESGGNDAGGLAHPILSLPSPEQEQQRNTLVARLAALEPQKNARRAEILTKQGEWEESILREYGERDFDEQAIAKTLTPFTDPTDPRTQKPMLLEVWQVLRKREGRSPEEAKRLEEFYLSLDSTWNEIESNWNKAKQELTKLDNAVPKTMVMRERATPRDTTILEKGAYNAPGKKVQHGLLETLASAPAQPTNRLQLATWIVQEDHPLTSRVIVNRLWQQLFGTGLVKTGDNFGIQGERPSHPELLDWLAVEFRESGWDLKHLTRLIVSSHTYRQTSQSHGKNELNDRDNRFLWRAPRYRLPSWMIRDQAIFLAGLLDSKMGGEPVKSYQPDGIWEEATFGQITYRRDDGSSLYRRSLYSFWRRIAGPTLFFDVSNRQACNVNVSRTNTPLHALVLLNDITYTEAARCLACRILNEHSQENDDALIRNLFQRCTSRYPEEAETQLLLRQLQNHRLYYTSHPSDAEQLAAVGEMPSFAKHTPHEIASWTALASILLNLDETISKE